MTSPIPVVEIRPAQANTSYTINEPRLFGGLNLGALSVTAQSVTDSNTVSVTVNNNGLVALGASLLVTVKP